MIKGKNSIVLLTNYHVIIDGLADQYKNAIATEFNENENMKKEIEQNAKSCKIKVLETEIKLSEELLIEGSSILSPITSVSAIYAHI